MVPLIRSPTFIRRLGRALRFALPLSVTLAPSGLVAGPLRPATSEVAVPLMPGTAQGTNWPIVAVLLSLSVATLVLGISLVRRRLLTNQLLRESEALLRSAQRLSKSGSWRLDPATPDIVFSAESFRLFGEEPDAVPNGVRDYLDYYEPDSRDRLEELLNRPPSPGRTAELRQLRSADGERVHECVIEASKDALVGTIADITDIDQARQEREQMQERLRQTERLDALGRLAGGIAHDFNNILAVSMTNAQLARMEIDDDHEAQESLKEVIDATERARELVRQIQIFGRRSTPDRDQIDLRACIESVMALLRASLPPNVTVRCSLPEEPLRLHGSATQIERVVMNLGVNASEAMPPSGGTIRIAARRVYTRQPLLTAAGELSPGDYIQLEVSDTGMGIDEDDLPRVFDPYFTRRGKEGGTGLGLALVHGIVQDHEGGLAVSSSTESEPDGFATTFSIWLPFGSARGPSTSRPARVRDSRRWSEPASPIKTRDQRLLVVDDERHVLRSTVRMLEALGFEAVGFSQPLLALEAFREDPGTWDGVVTDLLMSELSGAEMAERMKARAPAVPIVLMTGHAGDVDLESAATDAVIFKPALPGAWFEALRQVGVIRDDEETANADDGSADRASSPPGSSRSENPTH